jgi:hypothetical protein
LQALVQQLLDQLQAASSPHKAAANSSTSSSSSQAGRGPTPAAGEWQCSTAAVAAVLAEVLFGASAAWEPPLAALGQWSSASAFAGGSTGSSTAADVSGQQQQQQQQQGLVGVDAGYQSVLLQAVQALVKPRLWALPTSQPVSSSSSSGGLTEGSKQDTIPAQVRGSSARGGFGGGCCK